MDLLILEFLVLKITISNAVSRKTTEIW